ncbi:MAG: Crp/Fnr family transcriptional regulator [Caulobacteraceae bacterium]
MSLSFENTAARPRQPVSAPLSQIYCRLAQFADLDQAACDRIESLPVIPRVWRRMEEVPNNSLHLIVSGWACKMRPVAAGKRQIFVFLLPGDVIGSFRERSIHEFYLTAALEPLRTLDISLLLNRSVNKCPTAFAITKAGATLEEHDWGLIYSHMLRLGAYNVRDGMLDMLHELRDRLDRIGEVSPDGSFNLPIGQRVLAEAFGVSVVHINTTLKKLVRDGSIRMHGRSVYLCGSFRRVVANNKFAHAHVAGEKLPEGPV